jgi:IclR family acetate operon transcriptional repressor
VAVKNSQSALRVLLALERIVAAQPIGVSALARLIGEDRSATQRAIQTLADAGWIVPAAAASSQWELSTRLFMLAQLPSSGAALRRCARSTLDTLSAQTGESVFLAIPDAEGFIVIDVVESQHALRVAPRLGQVITARNTATGRAMLPYLDVERQAALLGYAPGEAETAGFEATRERGYSVSAGEVTPNTTNVAAAIVDGQNFPVAAIAVCAPSIRLGPERFSEVGGLITAAVLRLVDGS